ncbi:HMA2 domain-containing protein [uncultured Desulfovibrio sp.]|uniref:HMA2 domain-containing protein n=1 Tax=uncultured Desulfovibrio sp. TaxID=167968 RepID=UPI00261FE347|nr:hypothetical protein [uncultured Desulfovibrio sp.]
MLDNLRFIKYVRSFMDGRVRLRHPALQDGRVARLARDGIAAIPGVISVEVNSRSGSALLLYDNSRLSREHLMQAGVAWAVWLDDARNGHIGPLPAAQGETLLAN